MCGIAGFIGQGDETVLQRMLALLVHRGPDGEGVYHDDARPVWLGHRRLSIIDLEGGKQPMTNADGTLWVTYNGEIYNAPELRRELETMGYVFRTDHSDTEVLVHGYAAWGRDLPLRLNGMFAFAVYDKTRGQLFLARDRFGEKPLFYHAGPKGLVFASESTALLQHPAVTGGTNVTALTKYLAYGFIPGALSIHEGVRKVEAGTWLLADANSGAIVDTRHYWQFELTPDDAFNKRTDDDVAEELRGLISAAVGRRLVSDVPLGLFLSGGVDSTAILWAASQHRQPETLKTFTIGFNEASYDETSYAKMAAQAFGCQHTIDTLSLPDAVGLIKPLLARLDEPLADPSLLPTYLLSRSTRKHVAVALSGDAGDELFAGYDPFAALAPAQWYQRLMPQPLHKLAARFAHMLPFKAANMSLDFKLRRALGGVSYPPALWNPVWLGPADPKLLSEIMMAPVKATDVYEEAIALWERNPKASVGDRTLEFYTRFYLTDNILPKVDRASMMNSLESRVVFLDNDVASFCQRLPYRFKYRRGERKYILKKALAGHVPAAILDRRKKGFGIPLMDWLQTYPSVPPAAPLNGLDVDKMGALWGQHRNRTGEYRLLLWAHMALEYSHKKAVG